MYKGADPLVDVFPSLRRSIARQNYKQKQDHHHAGDTHCEQWVEVKSTHHDRKWQEEPEEKQGVDLGVVPPPPDFLPVSDLFVQEQLFLLNSLLFIGNVVEVGIRAAASAHTLLELLPEGVLPEKVVLLPQEEGQVSVPQDVQLQVSETQDDGQVEQLEAQQGSSFVLLVLGLLEAEHLFEQLVSKAASLALIVMIMAMVQLVLGVLSLLLLLVGVRVLHSSIVIQSLLVVVIFNAVFQLDVLGVFGVQEHVFRKDVDDCEDAQDL